MMPAIGLLAILIFVISANGQTQPTIVTSSLIPIVGQERSLACFINSTESTSTFPLFWYKDNATLTAQLEVTTPQEQTGVTQYTTFYNFTVKAADNQKVFSCKAIFPSGTTEAAYTINVCKGPDTPVITGPNVTVSGRISSWTCVVDGASSTAPNIFWEFDNGTRLSSSLYQNSESIYIDSTNLEIHKVTSIVTFNFTSGVPSFTFMCQAFHFTTDSLMSASMNVTVYSLPEVNGGGRVYNVTFGNNVTLDCTVVSVPPLVSVTWYKDGARISMSQGRYSGGLPQSPSLTISGVTKTDTGYYLCSGSNDVASSNGTASYLNVTSPPEVNGGGRTYNVTSGNNVTLVCTIVSVPPLVSVTWYKDGARVSMSQGRYSGGLPQAPSLTISGVTKTDTGYYLCSGGNDEAISNGTASYLNVTYKPVVTYSSNPVEVNSGYDVNLSCIIDSNPPYTSLIWFKKDAQGYAIPITIMGGSKYSGGSLSTPTLTIYSLVSSDAGFYTCSVDNLEGRGQGADLLVEVYHSKEVDLPKDKSNSVETIALAAVLSVAAAGIIGAVLIYCYRRRSSAKKDKTFMHITTTSTDVAAFQTEMDPKIKSELNFSITANGSSVCNSNTEGENGSHFNIDFLSHQVQNDASTNPYSEVNHLYEAMPLDTPSSQTKDPDTVDGIYQLVIPSSGSTPSPHSSSPPYSTNAVPLHDEAGYAIPNPTQNVVPWETEKGGEYNTLSLASSSQTEIRPPDDTYHHLHCTEITLL